jgi:hypothetical protein
LGGIEEYITIQPDPLLHFQLPATLITNTLLQQQLESKLGNLEIIPTQLTYSTTVWNISFELDGVLGEQSKNLKLFLRIINQISRFGGSKVDSPRLSPVIQSSRIY